MNDVNEFYSFEYNDGDARHLSLSFTPGDTWPEVLEQFVGFLSNVYGYDIRQKVGIKANPLTASTLDETWSGVVFNPEDEL
jgi:hypothetical protein